jgi:uncharacterized LabA/DUF88 family protein
MIDGGHLRVLARKAGFTYNPDYIEKVAHACVEEGEEILRILYYDCAPYCGDVKLPVSGDTMTFDKSDAWLGKLAKKDLFAVRRGVLKFRGWTPKRIPVPPKVLADTDFSPNFEQKGVDMRIGLDVAVYSANGSVDRLILLSGDTDCIPAMKHARKEGVQIVLVTFPKHGCSPELLWHSDFERKLTWPAQ